MRLHVKALTLASAVIWGTILLVVGIVNLAGGGYGAAFLRMMASIYPGYDGYSTFPQVVILVLYGFVDGAICGFLFAVVYNLFSNQEK